MLTVLIIVFIGLLVGGVPIFAAMLVASITFTSLAEPGNLIAIPHKMFNSVDSFILISIPFFLLVGQLMSEGSMMDRLLGLVRFFLGRTRGALAQVNIGTSILFAGISGTATGDAAAIGSVLIPSMVREGYSRAFSAAVTAASCTIGPIIPPSVIMVALGALVGVSVGRLFLAGVVPGLVAGLLMLVISYGISRRRGYGKLAIDWTWMGAVTCVIRAAGPLAIPLIMVGGLIGGIFTPTEASDIAVVAVLALGFLIYRDFTLKGAWEAIRRTLNLLGPVMLVISAASVIGGILIQMQVGIVLTQALTALSSSPDIILLLICAAVIVLGCFIEGMAIMFLLAPVLMPVVSFLGIDPVHFGLILVLALMLGEVTPPVGVSMFISCSIAKCSIEDFTRAIAPFFLVLIINLLLAVFFPEFVLWLPNLLLGPGG